MTVVIVGEVEARKGANLILKDSLTFESHEVTPFDDETFELEIGTTGIFIGEYKQNQIKMARYEIKKFLNPLYEEELLGEAGKIIVELVDDPFPDIFNAKLKEQEKLKNESIRVDRVFVEG